MKYFSSMFCEELNLFEAKILPRIILCKVKQRKVEILTSEFFQQQCRIIKQDAGLFDLNLKLVL